MTNSSPNPRAPTISGVEVPVVPIPKTARTKATSVSRRGSIRTRFLLAGLLPIVTLGGAWLAYTLTVQRSNDERLLLESVSAIASNYSERVLDLEESLALPLGEPEVISSLLGRTETLIQTSKLPITNVAVIAQNGDVISAYSSKFPVGSALSDQNIIKRWEKENPVALKAMRNVAQETFGDLLLAQQGYNGTVTVDGQAITLASALIPGNEGVSVITVDPSYIEDRIRQNVLRTLLFIVVATVITLVGTALATQPITRRLVRLAKETSEASRTSYDQAQVDIHVDGNDEVTEMQRASQRLVNSNRVLNSMIEEEESSL